MPSVEQMTGMLKLWQIFGETTGNEMAAIDRMTDDPTLMMDSRRVALIKQIVARTRKTLGFLNENCSVKAAL